MAEGEEEICKLRKENESLKEEVEVSRKAYTIETIIINMREDMREEEINDNLPIAVRYGLATGEEKDDECEEDWISQAGDEEIEILSDDSELSKQHSNEKK